MSLGDSFIVTSWRDQAQYVVGRILRSSGPLVLLIALFAILVRNAVLPLNFDTFFHLRFGHEFLGDWSLRHPGSVNSFATSDWLPTQWASQVAMAKVDDWFGLPGIAWLAGVLYLIYAGCLFLVCRREAALIVAVPVVALVVVASGDGLSARPQVLSYIFVAVTVGAWLRTAKDGKLRWWLIPLTWVWANMHGMWPLGIAIGLVAALGLLLDHPGERRSKLALLLIPLGSAIAAALTPVGPGLYAAVLNVGGRASYLSEWAPPDFTTVFPFVLALTLGSAVLVRLRAEEQNHDWTRDLLLLLACALAVYSTRTVPVAAALAAPLLAGLLQSLLPPRLPPTRAETVTIAAGLVAAVVVLGLLVGQTKLEPPQPSWLAARMSSLPPGTIVLSDSAWGGYLMWKYPTLDPVLHGYIDLYTDAELVEIDKMLSLSPGWESAVQSTHSQYALLRTRSPLAYALTADQGWRVIEESNDLELLQAP